MLRDLVRGRSGLSAQHFRPTAALATRHSQHQEKSRDRRCHTKVERISTEKRKRLLTKHRLLTKWHFSNSARRRRDSRTCRKSPNKNPAVRRAAFVS